MAENASAFVLTNAVGSVVCGPGRVVGLAKLNLMLLNCEVALGPDQLQQSPCIMVSIPKVGHGTMAAESLTSLQRYLAINCDRDLSVCPLGKLIKGDTFPVVNLCTNLKRANTSAHNTIRLMGMLLLLGKKVLAGIVPVAVYIYIYI